jgi:hypothetical protein
MALQLQECHTTLGLDWDFWEWKDWEDLHGNIIFSCWMLLSVSPPVSPQWVQWLASIKSLDFIQLCASFSLQPF